MVYATLKFIAKIALNVYFKKIHIEGKHNLPKDGPFLIVANHPSSFMDPVSIAVLVNQKISFLAKGEMFHNKIIASLLRGLNMVAIHRAQDNPGMLVNNENVFKDCYKKLSNNGAIMIFPEGTSEMERRLRKIKTGAARIALGAEKENNYNLDVKIIPVGLNYSKSSRFRSELTMLIGEPINVLDYKNEHENDAINGAKKLTEKIETEIRKHIIAIDKQEYDELIERVESIYKTELIKTTPPEENKNITQIKISQRIAEAVKYFQQNEPKTFDAIKLKIDIYFNNLKKTNLSDKSIGASASNENFFAYILKSVFLLILGFPIWLFGMINSYTPYKLPRFVALAITNSEAFYGALLMSLGTVFFVLFYSLEIVLVGYLSHSLIITLLYGIALPLSGLFTIYYSRFARKLYFNWQLISKFYSKQQLVTELMEERKGIIFDLETIHKKFNTL